MLKRIALVSALAVCMVAVGACSASNTAACDNLAQNIYSTYDRMGPSLSREQQIAMGDEVKRLFAEGSSKCGEEWRSATSLEAARRVGLVSR